ncbi:hypothetical protein BR93DRAFT_296068 [Coniochaeta sp. PMI_546]|nr:hypothetical protein BR93DRAFT_296068 [Coniochaeta sp. PMI_546]
MRCRRYLRKNLQPLLRPSTFVLLMMNFGFSTIVCLLFKLPSLRFNRPSSHGFMQSSLCTTERCGRLRVYSGPAVQLVVQGAATPLQASGTREIDRPPLHLLAIVTSLESVSEEQPKH